MLLKRNGFQKSSESADREKRLGNLGGYSGGNFAYQVFHPNGLSPALLNMGNGGGRMPHIVVSYEKLHNRSQPW